MAMSSLPICSMACMTLRDLTGSVSFIISKNSLRPGPFFSIAGDPYDPRVVEDGDIEIHRLFGLVVEPQERGDLLHGIFPSL
jgi:hypothetical protein